MLGVFLFALTKVVLCAILSKLKPKERREKWLNILFVLKLRMNTKMLK